MNVTFLAAPAALHLGAAALDATRHAIDFAGHLAASLRSETDPAAAQSADAAEEEAADEDYQSLQDFLQSIGAEGQEAVDWDHDAHRIARIHSERLEPWQSTSLRRWLDDRPQLKPVTASLEHY